MSTSPEASLSRAEEAGTTGGAVIWRYGIWWLLLALLLSRLPYIASEPYSWDSFNFLLSVDAWRPAEDMPHFPNYFNHVMVLHALRRLIQGDPLDVLHATSLLYSLLAVWLLHRFTRDTVAERLGFDAQEAEMLGLLTATLSAFNPMLWHFGEIGLSYSAGACVSIAGAWLVLWDKKSLWRWSWAALVIGWMGGFRPESLFLIPLLLWAMTQDHARLKHFFTAAGAGALGILLWFAPAVVASGQGWDYFTGGLHEFSFSRVLFAEQGGGWLTYRLHRTLQASGWLLFSIGFAPVALLFRISVIPSAWLKIAKPIRWFLVWWVIPPMVLFILTFYGGHFLFLHPPLTLLIGILLTYAARTARQAWTAVGVVLLLSAMWFTMPWERFDLAPPYTAARIERNDRLLETWRDAVLSQEFEGATAIVCYDGVYPWRAAMIDFPALTSIQIVHASENDLLATIARNTRELTTFRSEPPLPLNWRNDHHRLLFIGESTRRYAPLDFPEVSLVDSVSVIEGWLYVGTRPDDEVGSSDQPDQPSER